jgi:Cu+-exporting ATPase
LVPWILGFSAASTWVCFQVLSQTARAQDSHALLLARLHPQSTWWSEIGWVLFFLAVALAPGFYFFSDTLENRLLLASSILAIAAPASFAFLRSSFRIQAAIELLGESIKIKSIEAFERISEITVIAFDKTGTLTTGKPKLRQIFSIENVSHKDVLTYMASIEKGVDHPYADALVRSAQEQSCSLKVVKSLEVEGGKGLRAQVDWDGKWQEVVVGNLIWIYENGIEPQDVPGNLKWESEGADETALWLAVDKKILGITILEDSLRDDAKQAVQNLIDEGFEVGLITGDSENIAKRIAKNLQLKFFHYGVVPREKITIIKRLSEKKKKGLDFLFPRVAFIGDARNEGPALGEAYLGVALGSESLADASPAMVYTSSEKILSIPKLFSLLNRAEWRSNLWKIVSSGLQILGVLSCLYAAHIKWFDSILVACGALFGFVIFLLLAVSSRFRIQS